MAVVLAVGCSEAPPVAEVQVFPEETRLPHGRLEPLGFVWKATAPLERTHGELRVFVHVLRERGKVARTFDHPFPAEWTPGRTERYEIELSHSALLPALPEGSYPITVGLHDSWGYRWPLVANGEDVGKREYRVGTLVVPGGGAAPAFSFSSAVRSKDGADAGNGSRVVTGRGTVLVRGLEGPGTIRVLLDAHSELRVLSDCSPEAARSYEPGARRIDLPVAPGRKDCRIELAPAHESGADILELAFRQDP